MGMRPFAVALLLSASALPASAQGPWPGPAKGPLCSLGIETARSNCWPRPFTCWDQATVSAPFAVMIENGWRKQNLLADHHFDGTGTALNDAGKNKLRWILTEAPEQHRAIYVRRAESPEKTTARFAAVQEAAAGLAMPGERVAIVQTNVAPAGWPAERVDTIGRKFQASTPEPRLTKADGSGGGSSSSGNSK